LRNGGLVVIDVPLKGIHKVRKRLADGSVRTYY
jgi:hypothetical protein